MKMLANLTWRQIGHENKVAISIGPASTERTNNLVVFF